MPVSKCVFTFYIITIIKYCQHTIMMQINSLLKSNNFDISNQTELASLHLVDKIYYKMDAKEIPVNVDIDLSKAFDSLDHNILLSKLNFYGVTGVSLDLMSSYLSNRRQYTQFNTTLSEFLDIKQGVPQGSILGPLLFSIYINDLSSSSNLFEFLMYADDTTLYCSIDKLATHNINNVINEHLDKVNVWMNSNKLVLNSKKNNTCYFISIIKLYLI